MNEFLTWLNVGLSIIIFIALIVILYYICCHGNKDSNDAEKLIKKAKMPPLWFILSVLTRILYLIFSVINDFEYPGTIDAYAFLIYFVDFGQSLFWHLGIAGTYFFILRRFEVITGHKPYNTFDFRRMMYASIWIYIIPIFFYIPILINEQWDALPKLNRAIWFLCVNGVILVFDLVISILLIWKLLSYINRTVLIN